MTWLLNHGHLGYQNLPEAVQHQHDNGIIDSKTNSRISKDPQAWKHTDNHDRQWEQENKLINHEKDMNQHGSSIA